MSAAVIGAERTHASLRQHIRASIDSCECCGHPFERVARVAIGLFPNDVANARRVNLCTECLRAALDALAR